MDKNLTGEEINKEFGGSGIWAKDGKVMIKFVKDNEAVPLTPAEARTLANMLQTFAEQIEPLSPRT